MIMNSNQTITTTSQNAEATEGLAQQIGSRLKGGEVIELISDLGGGKTTFTRGLARGIGSVDAVASPTFTISKVYKAGALEIHHFDFYRLSEAGLIEHELQDLIGDKSVVIVVEWGDVVAHALPTERVSVVISRSSDDGGRTFEISYPESLGYLLEGVC
jgi:tRNA threonylcarbamoyladenosine biosynthesis protein TsaE